jgi:hypothetical protein
MTDPSRQRLHELLAIQTLGELSADEATELQLLQRRHPDVDAHEFARLAAVIAWSELGPPDTPPVALMTRLEQQATANLPAPRRLPTGTPRPWSWGLALALAACLLVGLATWAWPASDQQRLQRLLADSATLRLVAQGETPPGEVVWNPKRQEGYLVLTGVPANDPAIAQYQLWIFDEQRDSKFPVDGGVFDVQRDQDRVIVAFRPRLNVSKANLFAVTREKPGGVVVSERKEIVLAAAAR